jgi:hypothetical protein
VYEIGLMEGLSVDPVARHGNSCSCVLIQWAIKKYTWETMGVFDGNVEIIA